MSFFQSDNTWNTFFITRTFHNFVMVNLIHYIHCLIKKNNKMNKNMTKLVDYARLEY